VRSGIIIGREEGNKFYAKKKMQKKPLPLLPPENAAG